MSKLSTKQELFCQEYVVDFNATQAAIRSGYSKKTASVIASQHLSKLKIRERVDQLKAEITERNKVTVDELIETLASMLRFDVKDLYDEDGDLIPINELPSNISRMISAIEPRKNGTYIQTYSKMDALEKLMKYLGAYKEDNDQKKIVEVIIE